MLNKKLPDTELKIMKCIWNTGYKTVISKDVADEIEKHMVGSIQLQLYF